MAVDTATKRFAMLGFASSLVNLVIVDAVVSTEDRVSWLGLYNGFALSESVESNYRNRYRFDLIKMMMGRMS